MSSKNKSGTPRTRSFLGRSRLTCQACRDQHLKCNERRPTCALYNPAAKDAPRTAPSVRLQPKGNNASGNSTRIGAIKTNARAQALKSEQLIVSPPSDLPVTAISPIEQKSVVPRPFLPYQRDVNESFTFSAFTNTLAPILGSYSDAGFWIKTVLPAAYTHDQIFNATLALTTLYDMPLSEALSEENQGISGEMQAKYRSAIKWYCQSVNESLEVKTRDQSPTDIATLLLTSVIYLHVELRQGNYDNCSRLVRTAFAIVHSARAILWNCKESAVLTSLASIFDIPLTTAVKHTAVSREHWLSAVVLATKISADIGEFSNTHQLHFELANIMFDLDDYIINDMQTMNANDLPMDQRLQEWHERAREFQARPNLDMKTRLRLTRLECNYTWSMMRWNICANGGIITKELGRQCVMVLDLYERMVKLQIAANPKWRFPIWTFEAGLGPGMLGVAWHWRDPSILPRTRWICSYCEEYPAINSVLSFIEQLVETPYNTATGLEQQLFGRASITLQQWQQQRILHTLAQRTRTLEDAVVPMAGLIEYAGNDRSMPATPS